MIESSLYYNYCWKYVRRNANQIIRTPKLCHFSSLSVLKITSFAFFFINLSLKVYTFLANRVVSINLCLYLIFFTSWVLWEYYSPMIWTLSSIIRPFLASILWLHKSWKLWSLHKTKSKVVLQYSLTISCKTKNR